MWSGRKPITFQRSACASSRRDGLWTDAAGIWAPAGCSCVANIGGVYMPHASPDHSEHVFTFPMAYSHHSLLNKVLFTPISQIQYFLRTDWKKDDSVSLREKNKQVQVDQRAFKVFFFYQIKPHTEIDIERKILLRNQHTLETEENRAQHCCAYSWSHKNKVCSQFNSRKKKKATFYLHIVL